MYHGNPDNLAPLKGRKVAVGVCAGIASYKVCGVVSTLAQAGAEVTVAMTADAQRFVAPLVFQSLAGRAVLTSPWDAASRAHGWLSLLASCCIWVRSASSAGSSSSRSLVLGPRWSFRAPFRCRATWPR